jgi:hypothetical protein
VKTLPFDAALAGPSPSLRLRELADRLLKSCQRRPTDVQRWHDWKRGRRDLSVEMLQNAVAAGGKRVYARAVLLQLLSDFVEDGTDLPSLEEIQRDAIEADSRTNRVRQLALLDGQIDPAEKSELEVAITEECRVFDMYLERLRRSPDYLTLRVG